MNLDVNKASRCAIPLVICSVLLGIGLSSIVGDINITTFGLEAINSKTVLTTLITGQGSESLTSNAIVANTPQAVMSFVYLNYNALYTSTSLATEWDRLGKDEEGLRVSPRPKGAQRSTYFLQLPYRYSLPIVIFSGGVHWLISQSIFLVNLEVYAPSEDNVMDIIKAADTKLNNGSDRANFTTCGCSPNGVICVIAAGLVMIGFLYASGFRKLRDGKIPVASSCSAAIAAACHTSKYEANAGEKRLKWGVCGTTRDTRALFLLERTSRRTYG